MTDFQLNRILPGAWCVPSAIQCLTGADYESVIQPALNRHGGKKTLLGLVVGSTKTAACSTLAELGYDVRRYKHSTRHKLHTWAALSKERYPGRPLLVTIKPSGGVGHMLVIKDGRVYDTNTPHGGDGQNHNYSYCIVNWCALIQKRGS